MGLSCRIALVGDFDVAVVAHRAIVAALDLGGAEGVWIRTSAITDAPAQLKDFDGIWCVPASPYENTDGALAAIRFAPENLIPFLRNGSYGACGANRVTCQSCVRQSGEGAEMAAYADRSHG